MFTTFASFFADTYGFKAGIGGLTYLGLGVGFFLATLFGAKFADQVYQHVRSLSMTHYTVCLLSLVQLASKNGGVGKPEMRIPALFFGSFFIPIGVLCVVNIIAFLSPDS